MYWAYTTGFSSKIKWGLKRGLDILSLKTYFQMFYCIWFSGLVSHPDLDLPISMFFFSFFLRDGKLGNPDPVKTYFLTFHSLDKILHEKLVNHLEEKIYKLFTLYIITMNYFMFPRYKNTLCIVLNNPNPPLISTFVEFDLLCCSRTKFPLRDVLRCFK